MATDKKITTVRALQEFGTTLSKAWLQAESIIEVYFDRGYDTITDEDILDATGMKATQVTNGITLAQQFILFLKSGTITPGDYLATINQLRNDV